MKYYLIVYDQATGLLIEFREFEQQDRAAALEARFKLEQDRLNQPSVEVVVLGGESRADLERTHARYFKSITEMATGG